MNHELVFEKVSRKQENTYNRNKIEIILFLKIYNKYIISQFD